MKYGHKKRSNALLQPLLTLNLILWKTQCKGTAFWRICKYFGWKIVLYNIFLEFDGFVRVINHDIWSMGKKKGATLCSNLLLTLNLILWKTRCKGTGFRWICKYFGWKNMFLNMFLRFYSVFCMKTLRLCHLEEHSNEKSR